MMKKILVAVDDTKYSLQLIEVVANLFPHNWPETVLLLYVEKIMGRSLMDDVLLSDSEMETLKKSLKGTEHQEMLDSKAEKVIDFFIKAFEKKGITGVKAVIKEGHPAEEILKTAQEEGVEMIVIGSRGKRLSNLFMGSVSREVTNRADVSVLIARC
jgi:nucleotide-binding universal stress UspA family protein